eukprot:GFKZ01015631.1.p1 GENE.GFKZ01015631.1~~GFKZ01015631.1.p1  ORF type:complete len:156 (-),score=4.45 GFKZ01015631.1:560-1027(-)
MHKLNQSLTTQTANGTYSNTTHAALLHLKTSEGNDIELFALYNPTFKKSLLSAHDISRKDGPIIILPQTAHILDKRNLSRRLEIALWTSNGYRLQISPLVVQPAHTAPIISALNAKVQKNTSYPHEITHRPFRPKRNPEIFPPRTSLQSDRFISH